MTGANRLLIRGICNRFPLHSDLPVVFRTLVLLSSGLPPQGAHHHSGGPRNPQFHTPAPTRKAQRCNTGGAGTASVLQSTLGQFVAWFRTYWGVDTAGLFTMGSASDIGGPKPLYTAAFFSMSPCPCGFISSTYAHLVSCLSVLHLTRAPVLAGLKGGLRVEYRNRANM